MIKEILNKVQNKHKNIVIAVQSPKADSEGSNIFMGIGIAQRKGAVNPGLGVGTIGMAVTAIETSRALADCNKPSQIHILIPDQHAINLEKDTAKHTLIGQSATNAHIILQKLFGALGHANIHTVRSSNTELWRQIAQSSSYEDMEADDIVHAQHAFSVGVKVGWQSKRQPIIGTGRNDEKHFDDFAIQNRPVRMGFIRSVEGFKTTRESNDNHHLAPPYIGDENFALGQHVPDVRKRLKELAVKSDFHNWLVNLGNAITRLENKPVNKVDPIDQVQRIFDECKN